VPQPLPLLPDHLHRHFVAVSFSRHGGVSPPPWDSCNLSFACGDAPANVRENRQRVKAGLGLNILVAARQVHGDRVVCIDHRPAVDLEVSDCDALITRQPGIGLLVQQADCQAVLLADPVQQVVGICHCGWRGSILDIIGKTVAAMQTHFGSDPADLHAAVSPSLGPCCAEFVNHRNELPAAFRPYMVRPAYFDFWAISRDQLIGAGLAADRIHIASICTRCTPDYFSYRRDHHTGRCGTVVAIHPRPQGTAAPR